MSETAAQRALRLLDLVPFILRNQGISIAKLADAFQVSQEDILKDLNLLFMCGLPGYTPLELIDISFDEEYVVVKDPQNLAEPRNLSEGEALILRIALAAMEKLVPVGSERQAEVANLRERLNALFSSSVPKDAIFVDISRDLVTMQLLEKAIKEGRALEIEYLNTTKDQKNNRIILPQSISNENGKTLVSAFCKTSNGMRTFQVSNILNARESSESIDLNPEVGSETFGSEVELKIESEDSWFLATYSQGLARVDSYGKSANIYKLNVFQPQWLIRSVLSNSELTVQTPESLRSAVLTAAKMALARYASEMP